MTKAEVGQMPFPAVKMQEGAMSQGLGAALEFGIGKKTDSPLGPPERTKPSQNLEFGPMRPIPDF